MNTKLYVGNLAASTTERNLRTLISPHGNVAEVNLQDERESGQPCRSAIVTMATPQGVRAAVLALDGKEMEARVLTVSEQIPARMAPPATGTNARVLGRR